MNGDFLMALNMFKFFCRHVTFTWLIRMMLNMTCMVLCYLTNWFVVLFADKYGNLPTIFKLWQTYDNCLDIEWMISEGHVPKLFRYDFNKHYKYHLEYKEDDILIPGYVDIIDDNFTVWELIQRYVCRCAWLYRNCSYGFAYYIFGRKVKPQEYICELQERDFSMGYVPGTDIFSIKVDRKWYSNLFKKEFEFTCYIGYKCAGIQRDTNPRVCMIANRIWPFK